MFSSKQGEVSATSIQNKETPSIIAESLSILGNLVSESGTVEIQGCIEGNVMARTVTTRDTGFVKGDIVAEQVVIAGKTCGLIKARVVKLLKTARVSGVIMYETITIEDGALLDAQCKRFDSSSMTQQYDNVEYTEEYAAPSVARMRDIRGHEYIGVEEHQ